MVEITQRTIEGRFLLRPSERLNALVAGCLARAQKNTAAEVHAVAVLSNHLHLLCSFETVEQMAAFVGQLKTNLSKEISRLHGWKGPLFAGRYHAVPLSDEPEIHIQRLKYLLSQGAKEGLVLSPSDWPGIHCARALAAGDPILGVWVDRTGLYAARQSDPSLSEAAFTEHLEIQITPLPCFAQVSAEIRRSTVRALIEEVEAEALGMHRRRRTAPIGATEICRRKPRDRPRQDPTSRKPHFHATRAVYGQLMEAFRIFTAAYRAAADRLAAGDRSAQFPENCFPPRLPFVQPAPAFR
ncbi:MAG: transposase [Acidobacteriota bacterium]